MRIYLKYTNFYAIIKYINNREVLIMTKEDVKKLVYKL